MTGKINKIAKKLLIPIIMAALAIYGIAGMNNTIVEHSFFDSPFSAVVFILISAFVLLLWIFGERINASLKSAKPFFKKASICCAAAFLAEMCVFNYVSLYKGESVTKIPDEMILIDGEPIENGEIFLRNGSLITIAGEGNGVECIEMYYESVNDDFNIFASIKDDNQKEKFATVASTRASALYDSARLSIKPYGKLYAIELKISALDNIIEYKGVSLMSAKPFCFNHARMFLLLAVLIAIVAIKEFNLMKIEFDARKITHQTAVWAMALLMASSVVYFRDSEAKDYEYPFDYVANMDQYAQMYDSLEKDIPYLDIKVAPQLFELENVYDISQREQRQVPYIFDRAFFEGKYYSYFGIAPTLIFWKPYMALTGKIPNINTAHMFAAFISVFALFGTVLEFLKRYVPKVSAVMLMLGLFASVFLCGFPIALYFGDGYNVAPAFGIMHLLLTLFFGFAAINSRNNILRCILLAASAISFGLCIASRPTCAVGATLLIPAFVSMLKSKNYTVKTKVFGAASFALPILIGFVLIGKYNAERFGSPLDFGMAYQLTVCDVSQKSLDITEILPAIFHYFLAPANIQHDFPYISSRLINFSNYGHYLYNEGSFGAFNFAAIFAGVLLAFLVIRTKNCTFEKKCVYITGIIAMIFVAFFDFCYAGNNLRYLMDIMPVLSLISVAALLECHNKAQNNEIIAAPSSIFCALVFVQAFVFLLLWSLYEGDVPFLKENPQIYYEIKKSLVFWR